AHLHPQHHALLPVAEHGAPAVHVPTHHPDVHHRRLTGGESAAADPGVQHQVVHVSLVHIDQVDHQLVAGRHLDPVGDESHVHHLHPDPGDLPGGGDPRGRVPAGAGTGERHRVHRHPH